MASRCTFDGSHGYQSHEMKQDGRRFVVISHIECSQSTNTTPMPVGNVKVMCTVLYRVSTALEEGPGQGRLKNPTTRLNAKPRTTLRNRVRFSEGGTRRTPATCGTVVTAHLFHMHPPSRRCPPYHGLGMEAATRRPGKQGMSGTRNNSAALAPIRELAPTTFLSSRAPLHFFSPTDSFV